MIRKTIRLDSLTTLRVGGSTECVEITTVEEAYEALEELTETKERWYVLGGGSNVLASDAGFEGVVLLMRIPGITYREENEGVVVRVGAGVSWDALVEDTVQKEFWGLENLAGIPGTVGASPVQNIGAYGVEVKDVLYRVEAVDVRSNKATSFSNDECEFDYRNSLFKKNPFYIITHVEFILSRTAKPKISYKDIARKLDEEKINLTPSSLAALVRDIRNEKFPDLRVEGTAGSFFKNPIVDIDFYEALVEQYPDIPSYPMGENLIKIPLAYILDVLLKLRGFSLYGVRCFERQPLVIVASGSATSNDIDMFAREIEKKVFDATKIKIEREVQTIK